MTPDQLLSQAEEARQAGDQVRARSLINEAITIHLEWAAEEVAEAEEALQRAQFSRRLVMENAFDPRLVLQPHRQSGRPLPAARQSDVREQVMGTRSSPSSPGHRHRERDRLSRRPPPHPAPLI